MSHKIAVLGDVHANLPALDAALAEIERAGCDAIYHLGDLIGIGPYPAECLERLTALSHVRFLMGNHDALFVHGLPDPLPDHISVGEAAHQEWTHQQIDDVFRIMIAQWPYLIREEIEGVKLLFLHYPRRRGRREFAEIVRRSAVADLDRLFAAYDADLICFGHTHEAVNEKGRSHYLNPGALGCGPEAAAHYAIVTIADGRYQVSRHAVPYDDRPLFRAYVKRGVPERRFLARVFHGDRRPLPRPGL